MTIPDDAAVLPDPVPDTPVQVRENVRETGPPAAPPVFTFSGTGAEYFRIWIVNLLLTVATLGIYSAWAKTHRLQYFYRNTRLAGASFDFRGDPKAILRGRLLAAALLGAYHYAFGFSLAAGAVVVAALLAGLPFMMRSALRFRLSNTFYRGLPFGFCGGVEDAYRVYLAPATLFVLPGVAVALMPERPAVRVVFLLYLAWPFMHGAMRAYQHRHLMYGDRRSAFPLSSPRLARTYLSVVSTGLALGAALVVATVVLGSRFASNPLSAALAGGAVVAIYLFFLLSGPFVLVRMNNLAWSATSFPGVAIACRMRARSWLRLQVANALLTLLTLGLYRPFAVVRSWRYRVAHMHVEAPGGFEHMVLQAARRPASAAGDGAADFLGMDVSW
jgi:uncharacterized membrane protein YjgN (DUF898 family)